MKFSVRQSETICFCMAVFLCMLAISWAISWMARTHHAGQQAIISAYQRQLDTIKHSTLSLQNKRIQEEIAFREEIKSLLELEFNKLQNEYESVEIWTGILTVVFLIFSFYSIFKTEQMESQSREGLKRILQFSREGQQELITFKTQSKQQLEAVDVTYKRVKDKVLEAISKKIEKDKKGVLTDISNQGEKARLLYIDALKKETERLKRELDEKYEELVDKIQKAQDLHLHILDEEKLDKELFLELEDKNPEDS